MQQQAMEFYAGQESRKCQTSPAEYYSKFRVFGHVDPLGFAFSKVEQPQGRDSTIPGENLAPQHIPKVVGNKSSIVPLK